MEIITNAKNISENGQFTLDHQVLHIRLEVLR